MHVTGTYTDTNGSRYEGQCQRDNMHGTGTHTYADGVKYEGQWRDDNRQVTGTLSFEPKGSETDDRKWVHPGDKYEGLLATAAKISSHLPPRTQWPGQGQVGQGQVGRAGTLFRKPQLKL